MSVARPAASRLLQRRPGRERGAVLLAVMLIFITGAAYFLLEDLNAATRQAAREQQTAAALSMAKQGLIAYAVSYPDRVNADSGPGYLPCPDIDNDGDAEGTCADAGPTNFTVGRLPWQTLELSDPVDGSGERLWYALSENYRYGPNKLVPLNSETPGLLSVDAATDIVAVLIAPGAPVANQDTRNSAPNQRSNYLEGTNADGDRAFASNDGGEFNDRVLVLSRAELMAAVERRVLNDVATVLRRYNSTHAAYPWLAPFSDPRAGHFLTNGTASTGSVGNTVVDTSKDFDALGVRSGALVRDLADGSYGYVSTAVNSTIQVTALAGGLSNSISPGDSYEVSFRVAGVATGGSSGLTLFDASKDFVDLGVRQGDIVVDVTDHSIGVIDRVGGDPVSPDTSQLDLLQLAGGTNNQLTPGHEYEILRLPFHGTVGVRKGHLPIHSSGENYVSSFDVRWNLESLIVTTTPAGVTNPAYWPNADAFALSSTETGPIAVPLERGRCRWNDVQSAECRGSTTMTYFTGVAAGTSAGDLLADTTNRDFGNWGVQRGDRVEDLSNGSGGIITAVSGSTVTAPLSSAATFAPADNYRIRVASQVADSDFEFFVSSVLIDTDPSYDPTLVSDYDVVESISGGVLGYVKDPVTVSGQILFSIVDVDGNDISTSFIPPALGAYRLRYRWVDTREYEFNLRFNGDAVPSALASGEHRHRTVTSAGTLPAQSGTPTVTLNDYGVAGELIATRSVTIASATATGPDATVTVTGLRTDLAPLAGTVTGAATLKRFTDSRISFSDWGVKVGDVVHNVTNGTVGTVEQLLSNEVTVIKIRGSTEFSISPGQRYELYADFPAWLTLNNWHHVVLVGEVAGKSPGGGGADCTPPNCLTLIGGGQPDDNKQVIAVTAGPPLATQNRASGNIVAYFENGNAELGTPTFDTMPASDAFNDFIRVVDPPLWP
ncbi:MAG: hypothetical protein IT495_19955 [Gammaproteobacteria bacterium]|nr:hypothetical protein [Gammaproteobacteria bacterium]